MDCSTPVMMVDPPGWRAQSKSVAEGRGLLLVVVVVLLFLSSSSLWNCGSDWIRSLKAGRTAADAIRGTRGVSTNFQP